MANHRFRVFVLDDQPLVADTLAKVLESRGYEAHARYSSAEILDLATHLPPDLLIADVSLGPNQITGIDVAIYFQRFHPGCQVILISGNPTTSEFYQRAREQGHDFELLSKPINPEYLLQVVGGKLASKAA